MTQDSSPSFCSILPVSFREADRHHIFFRFLRQWRAYDASLRELSRLGDRELADIGISRSEIARVAWENAERTA